MRVACRGPIVGAVFACACLLAASPAAASTTILEAEAMQWGAQAGHVYSDTAASGGAGFHNWNNAWGTGTVDIPLKPTGLRVRLRSGQRSLGSFACNGFPQVVVKIGTTTVLSSEIAPSSGYWDRIVDLHGIEIGEQPIQIGLRNENRDDPLFPCDRWLDIDKLTIVGSRVFSPDSWRNRALAPDAPLDTDQSAAQRLLRQLSVYPAWVNTREWSAPIYVVPGSQPTVRVRVEPHEPPELATDWAAVPLPSDAMGAPPADGYDDRDSLLLRMNRKAWTDRSAIVYQPATDTLWEFIHLVKRNGVFYAGDGGKISNLSDSLGTWDPWPAPNRPHGTTGAGIPHTVGMQTIDEVTRRGSINHVVSMVLPHAADIDPTHPNPDETGVRAPAIRSDGDRDPTVFTDAIEEGTRFRLPASLDIDALDLTPYGKILARAIQRYGAVVVDRACAIGQVCTGQEADSRAAISFYAEQPQGTVTDPYVAKFGRGFPKGAFRNFPWDRMQVLPPLAP